MRRRHYLAVLGGAIPVPFLIKTCKPPRAWRTSWVLNDDPIVTTPLSSIDGLPACQTLLTSREDAERLLLAPEPFDADVDEYRRMDYDDRFVAITSVRLGADETLERIDSELDGETYSLRARVDTPESDFSGTHYEHLLETWILNGAERPNGAELSFE